MTTSRMARGPYRVETRVTLRFDGPLHVGSGDRLSMVSDSPLLRTVGGRIWLPGSSIRGALRDWCEREAPLLGVSAQAIECLFGVTPGASTKGDRQGRLRVSDALVSRASAAVIDHVRIDAAMGHADKGGKFDREMAFPGDVTVTVTYDGDDENDEELRLLDEGLRALADGLIPLGGGSALGMGLCRATKAVRAVEDRRDTGTLGTYLRRRLRQQTPNATPLAPVTSPSAAGRAHDTGEPLAWSWLELGLTLQFDGPMLTAGRHRPEAEKDEAACDDTYLARPDAGGGPVAVLLGSSLRGVLRAEARRIAAAIARPDVEDTLFGYVREKEKKAHRGLVSIGEGALVGDPVGLIMNHVALDRVTGFTAGSAKFDTYALQSPAFTTRLLLRWRGTEEHATERQAVVLLLFCLREAAQGLLWAGSRTTRGYGHLSGVTVTSARWSTVRWQGRNGRRDAPESLGPVSVADVGDKVHGLVEGWASVIDARRATA